MSASEIIDLMIYPFERLVVLLGSIQVAGMSLLSLLVAGVIISIIFSFFVGMHSAAGFISRPSGSGGSKKEKGD